MHLSIVSDQEIQQFFLSDPNLCLLGLTDENIVSMYSQGKYIEGSHSCILGVYEEETLVALFRWELFTLQTINVHVYISSQYQKKGNMRKVTDFLIGHLRDNTSFTKALCMVPETCTHVWRPLEHLGFTREGHLTKCLVWRQELVDMFIYGINIKRG